MATNKLLWWKMCLLYPEAAGRQRGQLNVTKVPSELLSSAGFVFAVFPFSQRHLALSCYMGFTHKQTQDTRFLLDIICCFFYLCCQQHTSNSPIGSSLFWTSQPSRVFQGNIFFFCEHVRSQLQVTNVYRHFAIWGWNHLFLLCLKNECPFRHAYGYWLLYDTHI